MVTLINSLCYTWCISHGCGCLLCSICPRLLHISPAPLAPTYKLDVLVFPELSMSSLENGEHLGTKMAFATLELLPWWNWCLFEKDDCVKILLSFMSCTLWTWHTHIILQIKCKCCSFSYLKSEFCSAKKQREPLSWDKSEWAVSKWLNSAGLFNLLRKKTEKRCLPVCHCYNLSQRPSLY